MGSETERKFLVNVTPDPEVFAGSDRLHQGYLAIDGMVEVRLRDVGGSTTLTLKAGEGLTRTELEVPVDPATAHDLWAHAEERSIDKTRHRVPLEGGLVAELDVYDGRLAGLRTVEVEFPDPVAAVAFTPPPWFGEELTGVGGWSNAELARFGIPGPLAP